jgi:hypothetical protein
MDADGRTQTLLCRVSSLAASTGGLRPKTTYHFRLVATNEGGTAYGKDKVFRTVAR